MSLLLKEYTPQSTAHSAASFLQSSFWAAFKALHGWTYTQYEVCYEDEAFVLTVLLRRLKIFGTLAYVPMGPAFCINEDPLSPAAAEKRALFLAALAEKLSDQLSKSAFLIRFDPPWGTAIINNKNHTTSNKDFPLIPHVKQKKFSCIKAPFSIQPPDTVHIHLEAPLETIFESFKSKWRYNIRLAEKKGVTVQVFSKQAAAETGIDIFYRLYQETAVRDGIAIHSKAYYRCLCELAADETKNTEKIRITMYTASHEGQTLAAIIVLFSEHEAVYLYGASSNVKRNLMPAYLLQWKAITDAKEAGCRIYDFYGIPPTDDPTHPMHGLYRFKTGFGGTIIHRVGSLDVPLKPARYRLYAQAERMRAFWFKTVKKKLLFFKKNST